MDEEEEPTTLSFGVHCDPPKEHDGDGHHQDEGGEDGVDNGKDEWREQDEDSDVGYDKPILESEDSDYGRGKNLMNGRVRTGSGAELPSQHSFIAQGTRRRVNHVQTVLVPQRSVSPRYLPRFSDHYTLPSPSSTVRFQSGNVHVYDEHGAQMILEEQVTMKGGLAAAMMSASITDPSERARRGAFSSSAQVDTLLAGGKIDASLHSSIHTLGGSGREGEEEGGGAAAAPVGTTVNVTVKRAGYSTNGFNFLRAAYSAIAIFIGGFIFILAVGLLLFLVSDLANEGRVMVVTNVAYPFVGTLLAIPVLLGGFSQVMATLTGFVVDVFNGGPLLRSFGWGEVLTNWVTVSSFVVAPFASLVASLMARSQRFWGNFLVTAFVSVSTFFVVFGLSVVYHRVRATLRLVDDMGGRRSASRRHAGGLPLLAKVKLSVLTAIRSSLSGKERRLYIYESGSHDLREMAMMSDDDSSLYQVEGRAYVHLTKFLSRFRLFETLDVPRRSWMMDEINGDLPFLTKSSWSLEGVFCRSRNTSNVVVVGGPSALTLRQTTSNIICYALGICLYFLLMVAILVWFGFGPVPLTVVTLLFVAVWTRKIVKQRKLARKLREAIETYQGEAGAYMKTLDEGASNAVMQKWEARTITQPTIPLICFYLAFRCIAFFVVPMSYLIYTNNVAGVVIFIFMSIVCFERHYLDMNVILENMGNFGSMGRKFEQEGSMLRSEGVLGTSSMEEWLQKSRIYRIQGLSRQVWYTGLWYFLMLFVIVGLGAVVSSSNGDATETETTGEFRSPRAYHNLLDPWMTFPNGTYNYQGSQSDVPQMCKLESFGDSEGQGALNHLADYAFLSNLPYFKMDTIQPLLDEWFGENGAILDERAVPDFIDSHPEFEDSLAIYHLVTFPSSAASSPAAVVIIRGTKTFFDYLADAKLWYSAALFQVFRAALPFGNLFDPLIVFSSNVLSKIETANVEKVAYYRDTSSFVDWLKDSGNYQKLALTGHSLGGGIALISGAQTHTTAVGLSGPNTVIGRDTVTPRISLEELEKYTFNIVPERDLFPRIGGAPEKMAKIDCIAESSDSFSCHAASRSLCEIMYSCGDVGRPVYCECVTMWGYPQPVKVSGDEGSTFMEECQDVMS